VKRIEHRDARGMLVGVELTARDHADVTHAIEVQSAPPALMRITIGGAPRMWARVWQDHHGWDWAPAPRADMPSCWPRVRAQDARTVARRHDWVAAWVEQWWGPLESVVGRTRSRIDVVPLGPETPHRYLEEPSRRRTVLPLVPGEVWWDHVSLVPSREVPADDDARVKAYRKQARDGTLPPIVLRWVSGLMAHLVVDGHARLVASRLEGVEPRMLAIVPVHVGSVRASSWTARAVDALESLLASASPGREHAISALNRAAFAELWPEWRAIERARPIPGGARAWRAEVAGLQTRAQNASLAAMLAPFEKPRRTGFVW